MPSYLPEVPTQGQGAITTRQQRRLDKVTDGAQLDVFVHRVDAAVRVAKDIADTEALSDAISVAADEELAFMREFRAKAGNSAAGLEIVGRKLEIFSTINNRRITRRFS